LVAATPTPRVVKLEILAEGEKVIASVNSKDRAVRYVVKVKIGGYSRASNGRRILRFMVPQSPFSSARLPQPVSAALGGSCE